MIDVSSIRWKHCKRLSFPLFAGRSAICWMLCYSLEGLPFVGCSAICWKVCHLLETLSIVGISAHFLEALSFVGSFVNRWRFCHSLGTLQMFGISAGKWVRWKSMGRGGANRRERVYRTAAVLSRESPRVLRVGVSDAQIQSQRNENPSCVALIKKENPACRPAL